MKKRLIILILVVASGVAFFLVADLESLSSAIFSMPAESMLALVLLLIANEIIKGFRWAYFLNASQLDIRPIDGVTSYLAAQAATALPGGSMLSARLAQEHGHVRLYQAAAGLVGQAVADIFALGVTAAVAILLTDQRLFQLAIPILALVVAFGAIALIRSDRLAHWVTGFLERWRITRRFLPEEEDFRTHSAILMHTRVMVTGAAFSIATTLISTGVLLTLVNALTERGVSPGEALYAHSLSTVARMVVPVPGGFGVSDGSLAGLLNFIGIGFASATFIALSYRTVGVIFRTFFGLLVLLARYPYLLVGPLSVPSARPVRLPRRARTTTTKHAVTQAAERLAHPHPVGTDPNPHETGSSTARGRH
jgi:uncharacterized membrane protein YbhN (UPF0104 family)